MATISTVAMKHNRLMLALVIGLMLFGAYSYNQLPSQEDPKITIREAVVTTNYPGMPAEKVELLITKTIEEAIRELKNIKEIRSVSLAGTSIIHAEADQAVPADKLDQLWDELSSELQAIRGNLPEGTGPFIINDDFSDVAVLTVALRSDKSFTRVSSKIWLNMSPICFFKSMECRKLMYWASSRKASSSKLQTQSSLILVSHPINLF